MAFLRGFPRQVRLILAGICIGAGLGVIILFGFNGTFPLSLPASLAGQPDAPSPFVGHPAPEFELTGLSGSPVKLSDYRGKVVLLNFWATWCIPCQQEMPLLQDRASRYPDKLVILGVNDDEPASLVEDFTTGLKITFPILLDPGAKVQATYRVRGYPTSIIIDGSGVIRYVHIGQLSGTMLDTDLKELGIEP